MMTFREFAFSDKPVEREKRENKAASAECTPLSIDKVNQVGLFSGSSGTYNTWIGECECIDFKRRNYPCKHMYRLAHELGHYNLDKVITDSAKIVKGNTPRERAKAYEKNVALIETYAEDIQVEIQYILSDWRGGMLHICSDISLLEQPISDGLIEIVEAPGLIIEHYSQKRTVDGLIEADFQFPPDLKPTKKARYEWCLEHAELVCEYVYPSHGVVKPIGSLEVAKTKTYTYLNRKFEQVYDFE